MADSETVAAEALDEAGYKVDVEGDVVTATRPPPAGRRWTVTTIVPTIPPRAELLRRALESIAAQSRLPDRVHVGVDHEALGDMGNRRRLVEGVDTLWLSFLDDDDFWLPAHLETMLETTGKFDRVGMVSSSCLLNPRRGQPAPDLVPPGGCLIRTALFHKALARGDWGCLEGFWGPLLALIKSEQFHHAHCPEKTWKWDYVEHRSVFGLPWRDTEAIDECRRLGRRSRREAAEHWCRVQGVDTSDPLLRHDLGLPRTVDDAEYVPEPSAPIVVKGAFDTGWCDRVIDDCQQRPVWYADPDGVYAAPGTDVYAPPDWLGDDGRLGELGRRFGTHFRVPVTAAGGFVRCYPAGTRITLHIDRSPTEPWAHDRTVSLTVPLNSRDEYTGGVFHAAHGPVDLDVGDVVAFTSTTGHEISEVESGERWVLVVFYTWDGETPVDWPCGDEAHF